MQSLSNNIKYIFLSFAQSYFENYKPLPWTYDVRTTSIIIADKMAIDIGVAGTRPCIVLSRNSTNWTFAVRGQDGRNASLIYKQGMRALAANQPNAGVFTQEVFTDLVRASVTFNVISKNGVQAEMLADVLNTALIGYKSTFKAAGVQQFNGIAIGGEQIVRTASEPELIMVPISIDCMIQHTIVKDANENNIEIFTGKNEYIENQDFKVITSGTQIRFLTLPELPLTVNYIDAITLNQITGSTPVSTSDPYVYTVSGGVIKGYYKISEKINVTNK